MSGNVGCALWGYGKIDDLFSFMIPIVEMAVIDSGSAMLAGVLLWQFCRINILKEYLKMIKKYWIHLLFWGGIYISGVSIINVNHVNLN